MKINGDTVTFETTGRDEYANHGIIGIAGGMVYGGYDAELIHPRRLTAEERNELADFMVAQWERFRQEAGG